MDDSTLIHELVHVWQYEQLGADYIPESLSAQLSNEGYDFGSDEGLRNRLEHCQGLTSFNFEQQAAIVEEYYNKKTDKDTDDDVIELYEHFAHDVFSSDSPGEFANGANENINLIEGGKGIDTLYGGEENDTIYGYSGDDGFRGRLGNDLIKGGNGNDGLYGGEGNDSLLGGNGNDSLYGEEGSDTLHGGYCSDYLDGGEGNDYVSFISDTDAFGVNANLTEGTVRVLTTHEFTETLFSIENLVGTNQNDTLIGNDQDNRLYGESGDDRLIGYSGDDILQGNEGDDYLSGGSGSDFLRGNEGNDYISGGSGSDYSVRGGSGNDTLYGYGGSDFLYGNSGSDKLSGGYDDDLLNGYGDTTGEYDTLTGGNHADIFIIGAEGQVFYPKEGFAMIEDFNAEQGDSIQIAGTVDNYTHEFRNSYGSNLKQDTFIRYQNDLIAVIVDDVLEVNDISFSFDNEVSIVT